MPSISFRDRSSSSVVVGRCDHRPDDLGRAENPGRETLAAQPPAFGADASTVVGRLVSDLALAAARSAAVPHSARCRGESEGSHDDKTTTPPAGPKTRRGEHTSNREPWGIPYRRRALTAEAREKYYMEGSGSWMWWRFSRIGAGPVVSMAFMALMLPVARDFSEFQSRPTTCRTRRLAYIVFFAHRRSRSHFCFPNEGKVSGVSLCAGPARRTWKQRCGASTRRYEPGGRQAAEFLSAWRR